jgi:glycine/D-amino acid oxidase-like deaminating enzyme
MGMTKYGRSPWLDNFPKSRVPSYGRQSGPMTADVVIVGGGLTGCATAYACAAAGRKVVLLEADRIGRGSTAFSPGWIADEPGVPFASVENLLGLRAARHVWRVWRRAALDFSALLRRLNVRCHLEPRRSVTLALSDDQLVALKREHKVRRAAGLDAPLINRRSVGVEVGVSAAAGLRSRDTAVLDPYRACLGLAGAASARGAQLFERSPATKIKFGRKTAEVRTRSGAIRTSRVVVATSVPTVLFGSLRRHFWFKTTYGVLTEQVPAKTRSQLGRGKSVIRDSATPPHVVRWVDDVQVLVVGADQASPPDRQRDKIVVQRTGQLMYELSTLYPDISGIRPEYGWDASYALTTEGLPYIGPHRNFPHHLFAFGDSSHGVTGAYLASRILLRHVLSEVERADEVFGFNR